jgi:DnaJ-class molecular chaperone
MCQLLSIHAQSQLYHAPEDCAWCNAIGSVDGGPCRSCNGKGYVVTLQPGSHCPACHGSGNRREPLNEALRSPCDLCGGSGWLIVR